jgi:hypothetical protein
MYNLFNDFEPTHGTIEFGKWRVLREMLQQTLAKAIGYYRVNRTYIDSGHRMVTLINSLSVPLNLETRVYKDRVEDVTLELSRMLGFTNPTSRGTMFAPGLFYGKGVAEAILTTIEDFDLDNIEENWRDYAPIRILRHPRTDLGLWALNGTNVTEESGLAVISINVPMLASQYRMWRLTEGVGSDGDQELITTFLSRYPMANALTSHFDVAFFNRLACLFTGKTPADDAVKTPFWQMDLHERVDSVLIGELVSLTNRRITFDDILTQIPCITEECLGDLFRIPERGLYVRQVIWIYALFRLPLLAFLLQQNARNANQRNTYYLKEIRRFFIATGNDRDIIQSIPGPWRLQVMDEIRLGILPYLDTRPQSFGFETVAE